MTFYRILLFLFFFYLLFRIMGRYVLPWLVSRYVKKQKEKYEGRTANGREGEIHIRRSGDARPKVNADAAEYVDFEDIDDETPKE
ncbi:MAG: hypothetical protein PHU97_02475 [Bacteroidales bacterium]|nr:hypothetical protein [Bacteroidales bacterium]MDD3010166.1 hypothetical protein [Bacteroidales bacterium]MDD3961641.1 hypothetical protein [Bacteroidales bacterium]HPE87020.1 hypothetical protein [Bacteroidales bacterium]